jgi:hypothetical protein
MFDIFDQNRAEVTEHFPETLPLSWDEVEEFLRHDEPNPDLAQKKAAILLPFMAVIEKRRGSEFAMHCFGRTQEHMPFICGEYVGIATADIQSGDTLADLDCDSGSLFILRTVGAVGDRLFKVVGFAYVAQLWEERELDQRQGTRATFRLW